MTKYDSSADTWKHINQVQAHLNRFISELMRRGHEHDQTKLKEPEKTTFDEWTPKLAALEYGSDEYNESLKNIEAALEHHYAKNSHHPEHYPEGVNDMTLMDVIEMFCDWKAATERMHDGNIRKSLEVNKKRFKLSPQLYKIFENTVKEFGW